MGKDHLGQPSGTNRNEGLGNGPSRDPEKNEQLRQNYTEGDNLGQNANQRHKNRNTDKGDSTRAGGYKRGH